MTKLIRYGQALGLSGLLFIATLGLVSCGGGGSSATPTTGTVNTSLTDPTTCSFSISDIWVTVTKVTANINGSAGPNDSGWVTLVDLTSAPKQIDLPNLQSFSCLLTQLGSTTLPAGKYQQIRLYLLSNNPPGNAATPSPNACTGTGGFNCVVPKGGSPELINLSSEAQTGIKIPSSKIASGGLTVTAGQAVDLNIDINSCQSVVSEGNGQWRLKPVLMAGEVETNNNAISGTVVDSVSKAPIAGAVVSLEVADPTASNVDIVSTGMVTNSSGNFSFCPLTAGATYDVVVTAMIPGATPVTYNATVTFNVPVGSALGNIPMVAEPTLVGTTTVTSQPAILQGQVTTTSNTSNTGATAADATSADISLMPLQAAGTTKIVTILPFSGSTTFGTASAPTVNNLTNTLPATCPTGTKCENFVITVPASNPSFGTFAAGSTTSYSTPTANPALYWLRAVASLPGSSTTPPATDCTPSSLPANFTPGVSPTGNQIGLDPPPMPDNVSTQNFGFVSCTSGF